MPKGTANPVYKLEGIFPYQLNSYKADGTGGAKSVGSTPILGEEGPKFFSNFVSLHGS